MQIKSWEKLACLLEPAFLVAILARGLTGGSGRFPFKTPQESSPFTFQDFVPLRYGGVSVDSGRGSLYPLLQPFQRAPKTQLVPSSVSL